MVWSCEGEQADRAGEDQPGYSSASGRGFDSFSHAGLCGVDNGRPLGRGVRQGIGDGSGILKWRLPPRMPESRRGR